MKYFLNLSIQFIKNKSISSIKLTFNSLKTARSYNAFPVTENVFILFSSCSYGLDLIEKVIHETIRLK